jgi:phage N-6-adenine-methyltransferase
VKGQAQLFANARTEASRAAGSTDVWSTPQAFFDMLNEEFVFTLDPCADASNAKCTYFDEADDGLAQDWGENVCFVNFPYSQAKAWAAKCIAAASSGATVVVLCAARTDTGWWQSLALAAEQVRFVKGRLAFVGPNGAGQSATFPSCVIVLRPGLEPQGEPARMFMWEVPAEVRR